MTDPRHQERPALARGVRRAPDVTDDELVLYDARTHATHVLNRTGAVLWRLLDQPRQVDDLAGLLAEAYTLPPEAVAQDVLDLVQRLRAEGLVDEAEAEAEAEAPPDPADGLPADVGG